jgi:nitroreductase
MKKEEFLSSRHWRYATKKFDPDKRVSPEALDLILEAIRLTPTSYGLQPFKVLTIESTELREALREAGFGQSQFTDASHLLAFAHLETFSEELIERFARLVREIRNPEPEKIEGYASFLKTLFGSWTNDEKSRWADKQMYIALGNALQAAAELKVDSCALEGFDIEKANALLQLPLGLKVTAFLALGYRSTEDKTQHLPKVRVAHEDLFVRL